jgi:hypothetical protein
MFFSSVSLCLGVTPHFASYSGNLSYLDGYHRCTVPYVLYQGIHSFPLTVSFGLHIFSWSKSIGAKSGSFFCHFVVSIKISTKTNGVSYPVANCTFITVYQLSHLDPYRSCPRVKFKPFPFFVITAHVLWLLDVFPYTVVYFGIPFFGSAVLVHLRVVINCNFVSNQCPFSVHFSWFFLWFSYCADLIMVTTNRKNPYAKAPPVSADQKPAPSTAQLSISPFQNSSISTSPTTVKLGNYPVAVTSPPLDTASDDDYDYDDDDLVVDTSPAVLPNPSPVQPPALPPMNMLIKQHTNDTDQPSGWDLVGASKFEKDQRKIFASYSQQYLPRNLPLGESTDYVGILTSTILCVTVQIRTPAKASNVGFKRARVLLAVLKLFQSAYSDSYIGSVKGDAMVARIIHPEHIPLDEAILLNYMVKPVVATNRVYSTKVLIHTNHTLKEFKIDPNFRSYIGEEGIVIDNNTLATAIPINIGFLENVIPRQDTLHLHHERIMR